MPTRQADGGRASGWGQGRHADGTESAQPGDLVGLVLQGADLLQQIVLVEVDLGILEQHVDGFGLQLDLDHAVFPEAARHEDVDAVVHVLLLPDVVSVSAD